MIYVGTADTSSSSCLVESQSLLFINSKDIFEFNNNTEALMTTHYYYTFILYNTGPSTVYSQMRVNTIVLKLGVDGSIFFF
jgi:hypothetical protein